MAGQPMTDLDKKLQEMAVMNWPQFVALVGEDALMSAKICLLRQNGNSYGQIKNKFDKEDKLTENKIRYACNKCEMPKA